MELLVYIDFHPYSWGGGFALGRNFRVQQCFPNFLQWTISFFSFSNSCRPILFRTQPAFYEKSEIKKKTLWDIQSANPNLFLDLTGNLYFVNYYKCVSTHLVLYFAEKSWVLLLILSFPDRLASGITFHPRGAEVSLSPSEPGSSRPFSPGAVQIMWQEGRKLGLQLVRC